MSQQKVGFGGGCHWCTEAVFQALRGVTSVEQGFIRSTPPNQTWSEAVIVTYDTDLIDLETLANVHIRTHAATAAHSMRPKYRSAIYIFSESQQNEATIILDGLGDEFENGLVTEALPFVDFKPSEDRLLNYYETNPDRPFCRRYIDPKLDLIRKKFSSQALAGI